MKITQTLASTAAFSMRAVMSATLLLLTPCLAFAATSVAIDSTSLSTSATQIIVTGSGFEPATAAPTVQFNGATLTVKSFKDTQIVADLPTGLQAGTYSLTVTNSQGSSKSFDVAYGAVGPAGPTGPTGPCWGNRACGRLMVRSKCEYLRRYLGGRCCPSHRRTCDQFACPS